MGKYGDFHSVIHWYLIQAMYSGFNPDGSWRYGPPEKDADGVRRFVVPESAINDGKKYEMFRQMFPDFSYAFDNLEDELSAKILIMLVGHRILGPERVVLNISHAQYRKWMDDLAPLLVKPNNLSSGIVSMVLDLYDLHSAGIPIRVNTTRSSLLAHFFLRQYEYKRDNVLITVEPGDTVIEGGMCYGDTGLFFSHLAGEKGRVLGFEFEPANLQKLKVNFDMNPELTGRIKVIHNALGKTTGEKLTFAMAGPATTVAQPGMEDRPTIETTVLTIDDLVEREKLDRVDFIKLDVEGSEMDTMIGATRTLRRFRPKLALSAYHRYGDIPELIKFLTSLDLGYKYYLDHFRYYIEETVLFAKAE